MKKDNKYPHLHTFGVGYLEQTRDVSTEAATALMENLVNTLDLKADPMEGLEKNYERAEWAAEAVNKFIKRTGTDPECAIGDLICNLMHLCDRLGIDIEKTLRSATANYREEAPKTGSSDSVGSLLASNTLPCTGFQVTEIDIMQVLDEHNLLIVNKRKQSSEESACELILEIDHQRIQKAALNSGNDLDTQTAGAQDEIKKILVEKGVLEF